MKRKIEVMRVQRMPPLGKLAVTVRDNNYESLASVKDPALRQRLLAAIGELIDFAGGYQVLVDAGVASPLPTVAGATATEEANMSTQQEAFLSRLEKERQEVAEQPVQPPVSILSSVRRKPEPPPKPVSLVEQIDAILQEKVESDPRFADRSIHLMPDPQGGLRIEIDGRRYERPSQIEEKEIAILIKMAIREWENKS